MHYIKKTYQIMCILYIMFATKIQLKTTFLLPLFRERLYSLDPQNPA